MSSTHIPFLDLVSPHLEMEEELVAVFRTALHSAAFIGGKAVQDFENAFAEFCEVNHCVGVGSGTGALRFALMAAGVSPGDSVLTVPNTFIATTEAISQAGAQPEFIDIDERTYNMDTEKLREYLETKCDQDQLTGRPISRRTGRTISAVVPVQSLRTDRRHGSDSGAGRSVEPHRNRRRLPGSWRRALLAKEQTLGKSWIYGKSSSVQFLSCQESRCLR